MLAGEGTERVIQWRQKEMAHDPVRTTDVALGVECALPAGFEAWDSRGAPARPASTVRSCRLQLTLGALFIVCFALGAWQFS